VAGDSGATAVVVLIGLGLTWLGYRAGHARSTVGRTWADFLDARGKMRELRKLRWVHFWTALWTAGLMWLGVLVLLGMARHGGK